MFQNLYNTATLPSTLPDTIFAFPKQRKLLQDFGYYCTWLIIFTWRVFCWTEKKYLFGWVSELFFYISSHSLPYKNSQEEKTRGSNAYLSEEKKVLSLTNFIFNFLLKIDSRATNIISHLPFSKTIFHSILVSHTLLFYYTRIFQT